MLETLLFSNIVLLPAACSTSACNFIVTYMWLPKLGFPMSLYHTNKVDSVRFITLTWWERSDQFQHNPHLSSFRSHHIKRTYDPFRNTCLNRRIIKYLNRVVFSIHLAGVLTCLLFFIQETRLGTHDWRAINIVPFHLRQSLNSSAG